MPSPDRDLSIDVYVLRADADANAPEARVGMGFVIGPRHVLTCAHVVADALADGQSWVDREDPPRARMRLAFAMSRVAGRKPVEAVVRGWWPMRSTVENWPGLDDVALLELAPGVELPADVGPARPVTGELRGLEVDGAGISKRNPDGVTFYGMVRGRMPGNRWVIRSVESADDRIVEGCSGAAVQSEGGVAGMVAERQQENTGLFMSAAHLLAEPAVSAAWTQPFVSALDAADDEDDGWAQMSLGARLERHLPDCDRESVWTNIKAMTWKGARIRMPAIGVFEGLDDDLPKRLYERFQRHFLVEAGKYAPDVVAHPDVAYETLELSWRQPGQPPQLAFKLLKRQLTSHLAADDADPKAIRKALKALPGQAFYSEVDATQLGPDDLVLLEAWAAYWDEIGAPGIARSMVHLICVRLPAPDFAPAADLRAHILGLPHEVALHLGALPGLRDSDFEAWLKDIARYVGLRGQAAFTLRREASRVLDFTATPRLRRLQDWLFELKDSDLQ